MLEIRTVAAGRGAAWLMEGFDYFKNNVGAWIGIVIVLLIITSVSTWLPIAGLIFQIVTPILMGGLMLGCREAGNGGHLRLNHLFACFSQNTGDLLLLGVFYLIGTGIILVVMFIMVIISIGSMAMMSSIMEGDTGLLLDNLMMLLVVVLIGLMLYIPLLMAFWFGPALVVFEGQNAVAAMKYSFIGCVKNLIPFLVYGVVGMVLAMLASIPFMLGWFILIPMTIAGFYISYRDIYTTNTVNQMAQP